MELIFDTIVRFFTDARLHIILALIALDVLTGVAEALKNGVFDWEKVAEFYRTKVMPYVIGYLALYVAIALVADLDTLLGTGLVSAAWGVLLVSLVASTLDHLKGIGIQGKG